MVDTFAPKVFDSTAKMKHIRRARQSSADEHFLHAETAERLADRLLDIDQPFETVAVMGWWPTPLQELAAQRLKGATIIDLSFDRGVALPDLEFLPLKERSFDLMVSNMCLHWANDLPGMLSQIHMTLKPNGVFLGAALGGETLQELRASFVEAETSILGGSHPRVSPVMDLRDAAGLIQRAGFNLPVADIDRITTAYENPLRLLQDLRSMGQSNAVVGRCPTFTSRRVLFAMLEHYQRAFALEDGAVPATFDCLFMSGWAPHDSQQKPLRPGAAKNRLADALGTTEIPLSNR